MARLAQTAAAAAAVDAPPPPPPPPPLPETVTVGSTEPEPNARRDTTPVAPTKKRKKKRKGKEPTVAAADVGGDADADQSADKYRDADATANTIALEPLRADHVVIVVPDLNEANGEPVTTATTTTSPSSVRPVPGLSGLLRRLALPRYMSRLPPGRTFSLDELVHHFSPAWFSVSMGTGVIAQLMWRFPYAFRGQDELAWLFWSLNVLVFSTCLAISLVRAVRFPGVWRKLLRHPFESMFLGTVPMGLTSVIHGLILVGPRLGAVAQGRIVAAAHVLWWTNATLAAFIGWLVPWFAFAFQRQTPESFTALWLLPVIPCGVVANAGGLLAPHLPNEAAYIVVITSYILWALSLPVALCIITLFFQRLALFKLPPHEVVFSSLIPLSPLGMGAMALLNLGAALANMTSNDARTYPSGVVSFGQVVEGVSLLPALLLDGFGIWWFVIVILVVGRTLRTHTTIPFYFGWWALAYPVGVFALAQTTVGSFLDYAPLIWFGAVLTWAVVVLWGFVASRTFIAIWTGEAVVAPSLAPVPLANTPSSLLTPEVDPADRAVVAPELTARTDTGTLKIRA